MEDAASYKSEGFQLTAAIVWTSCLALTAVKRTVLQRKDKYFYNLQPKQAISGFKWHINNKFS